jgi:hypothetical protein
MIKIIFIRIRISYIYQQNSSRNFIYFGAANARTSFKRYRYITPSSNRKWHRLHTFQKIFKALIPMVIISFKTNPN